MIRLYYAPDNASLIVRILLEELKIPYSTVLVDRSTCGQNEQAYLDLNPNGLIPVCIMDGKPIFETAAILLSLADKHQRFTVLADSSQRPDFLKWLIYLSNSLHVDCRMRFYPEKYAGSDYTSEFTDLTFSRLCRRLDILDTAYQATEGLFLYGAEPTIVDFYLAVCMRWIQLYPMKHRGELNVHAYPSLLNVLRALEVRDMTIAACNKEGISGAFFSSPEYANPPEGVAL